MLENKNIKNTASLKNYLVQQQSLELNDVKEATNGPMFFSAKRDVFPLMQTAVWNKPIGGSIVVRELDLRHRRARQQ